LVKFSEVGGKRVVCHATPRFSGGSQILHTIQTRGDATIAVQM
jgi:hypothetical protein